MTPVTPSTARATPVASIARDALENYAADLLRLITECEEDLANAANGRKVAWADKYAEQVFKDMKHGQSAEGKRLLAVLLGLLARGAKLPRVRLVTQRLDAIVARFAQGAEPRPIRILNRRETREDAFMDMAQMRLEADTNDLEALEALVRQIAFYRTSLDELDEAALDRIVALRGAPQPRQSESSASSAAASPARHLSLLES